MKFENIFKGVALVWMSSMIFFLIIVLVTLFIPCCCAMMALILETINKSAALWVLNIGDTVLNLGFSCAPIVKIDGYIFVYSIILLIPLAIIGFIKESRGTLDPELLDF